MDIQTVSTRYALRRLRVVTLDLQGLGASVETWLQDLFRTLAKRSLVDPIQHNELQTTLKGFRLLASSERWRVLIRRHPREIRTDELMDVYRLLEGKVADLHLSQNSSRQMFDGVRRFIKRYLKQRSDCPQSASLADFYPHTRFSYSKSRALISDQVSLERERDQEPVAALSHSSVKDLKEKTEKRLSNDLQIIQAACVYEIKNHLSICKWLDLVSAEPRNEDLKKEWDGLVGRHSDVWRRSFLKFSARDVLREFLLRHAEAPKFRPSLFAAFVDQARLLAYVAGEINGDGGAKRLSVLIRAPHLLSTSVLVCFVILLQIHTCWNISSLLELTTDCIKADGDGFSIQGFKSKTNSRTPIIWIFPQDGMVFDCVNMLLKRLAYLKQANRIGKDETRIWIASRQSNELNTQTLANLSGAKAELIKKHRLPYFSFEQIRVQCLARIYLGEGGMEAARRAADHANIKTTAHYLDQLMLSRLNSSINLEFQRRLERNVRFNLSGDEDMLYPVGDGSSCTKPQEPPNKSWLEETICKAENCHAGSGCPNNKLMLDAQRIEEIVLTTRFYENNWRRLASQNTDAFRAKHLPAMLFNLALHGYVTKGPYGHLLRRAEEGWQDAQLGG